MSEAREVVMDMADRVLGQNMRPQNSIYQAVNNRLMTLCREFGRRPLLEFLRAIAYQVPKPGTNLAFGD